MYLNSISNVFSEINRKYLGKINFVTIGAGKLKTKNDIIKNHNWSLDTEVKLLQSFDIGIMPLFNDDWSKGKGGYKLLQYMSLGIPSIASPVGINCELVQHGVNGYLAKDDKDWIEILSKLIENDLLRKKIGNQARIIAEQNYTFEINSEIIIDKINKI